MIIFKQYGMLLIIACAILTCSAAVVRADDGAPAAKAPTCTVTETNLANGTGWNIVKDSADESSDANHFACALQQGDKQAIAYDGVVGKAYDGHVIIYFSNKGERVAYYIKHDNDKKMYVIVDGVASDDSDGVVIRFTPDDKHWAYLIRQGDKETLVTDTGEINHWTDRMGNDGYPIDIDWVEYSPDSQRMAYTVDHGDTVDADIDGTEGPAYDSCTVPQFSPDSKRVFYWGWRGERVHAVVDGVESAAAYDEFAFDGLIFSPDSQHTVFAAKRDGQWYLVIDGKETAIADNPTDYYYSPDSKHLMYDIGPRDTARTYVDGEQVTGGDDIEKVVFNCDGTRKGYTAKTGDTYTMTIDGLDPKQYTASYCAEPIFSPDGKRVAYFVQMPGDSNNYREVVDGVESSLYDNTMLFHFSPDSQHYVYEAKRGNKWLLVVDGAEVYTADAFLTGPVFDSADTFHLLAVQSGGNEAVRTSVHIGG